jgi:hypothetical protein
MEDDIKIPEPPKPNIPERPLKLGSSFITQKGEVLSIPHILKEEFLLCLFFGNSKCVMCENFLPKLVDFYVETNLERKLVEVLYVPVFEDKVKYAAFQRRMPWLYLPPLDERVDGLIEHYEVKAIPKLLVVRHDGTVLTPRGKDDIYRLGEEAYDHWLRLLEEEARIQA